VEPVARVVTRSIDRLLPRGSVEVVPDAAYLTPLETPAELATLVRRHWAA
jgi:hypothetical protein